MNVGELFLAGPSLNARNKEGKAIIQVASLFNQLLQHFPRTAFAALVKNNDAELCAKGFGCWTQLVSMLFCQLAYADSLPEICNGLGCCLGKLVHLGIAPRRRSGWHILLWRHRVPHGTADHPGRYVCIRGGLCPLDGLHTPQ